MLELRVFMINVEIGGGDGIGETVGAGQEVEGVENRVGKHHLRIWETLLAFESLVIENSGEGTDENGFRVYGYERADQQPPGLDGLMGGFYDPVFVVTITPEGESVLGQGLPKTYGISVGEEQVWLSQYPIGGGEEFSVLETALGLRFTRRLGLEEPLVVSEMTVEGGRGVFLVGVKVGEEVEALEAVAGSLEKVGGVMERLSRGLYHLEVFGNSAEGEMEQMVFTPVETDGKMETVVLR